MKEKLFQILTVALASVFVLGFTIWSLALPDAEISDSERRPLSQFPNYPKEGGEDDSAPQNYWEAYLSGSFMKDFESWTLDQFPLRDNFRAVKAVTALYGFRLLENNDFFISNGYISKIDRALNTKSIDYAAGRLTNAYNLLIKDKTDNVYFSIVPDKTYIIAGKNGCPTLDYGEMVSSLTSKLSFAKYIDLFPLMELEDYYRTDTHWTQEKIQKAAKALASAMGVTLSAEYEVKKLDEPFYGVYYKQATLPLAADEIYYLENDILRNCKVYDYETGTPVEMSLYDMEKAHGKDPYEMFLGGSKPLITIENPAADTDRELIVFRDSFGSSLSPLFVEGYKKITICDIRYVAPNALQKLKLIEPTENTDVLFVYSSLVLNSSGQLK